MEIQGPRNKKFTFTGDPHDKNWYKQAECASGPLDTLYPETTYEQHQAVKDTCRVSNNECPVQAPCLVDALKSGRDSGVWGGLTERERRSISSRFLPIIEAEEANAIAEQIRRNSNPQDHARVELPLSLVLPNIDFDPTSQQAS